MEVELLVVVVRLSFSQSVGVLLKVIKLLFDSKGNVLFGRIYEVLHLQKLDLEQDEVVFCLDDLTLLADVIKHFLDEAKVMWEVFVFFEHRLPGHEFEESWDHFLLHLKGHSGLQGSWWLTEASLSVELELVV